MKFLGQLVWPRGTGMIAGESIRKLMTPCSPILPICAELHRRDGLGSRKSQKNKHFNARSMPCAGSVKVQIS
jgi:hypothetical protein